MEEPVTPVTDPVVEVPATTTIDYTEKIDSLISLVETQNELMTEQQQVIEQQTALLNNTYQLTGNIFAFIVIYAVIACVLKTLFHA